MSITYPPEMLPSADDDAEVTIVVDGQVYRWRNGKWLSDAGEELPHRRVEP